jgi:uncharacterized protein (TIGR02117 family)
MLLTFMTRKIIKRIFKLLKQFFIFLISSVIVYFVAALIFSVLKTHPPKTDCLAENEIFITTNGVHLDIVLPIKDINPEFLNQLEILPGTKYVSFGWGDKEFYINTPEWKDLTFKTAFKALFLKSETAMHFTCYSNAWRSWKTVKLCNLQLDVLNSYIENSFTKNDKGGLQKIAVAGYYESDAFYEAKGSFSLFKTCNVWVNKALKVAGVETSVWSPFDFGVLYHLPE